MTSKDGKKWEAKITENGRTRYLGFFDSEIEGGCRCVSMDDADDDAITHAVAAACPSPSDVYIMHHAPM